MKEPKARPKSLNVRTTEVFWKQLGFLTDTTGESQAAVVRRAIAEMYERRVGK